MQIKDYVKPELLVVAVVLYFIGMWLKQRSAFVVVGSPEGIRALP